MNLQTSDLNPSSVDSSARAEAQDGFLPSWQRLRGFLVFAVVLAAVFCRPLWELLKFAPHKELYSHILLIPFISGYLIWTKRRTPVPVSRPNRTLAIVPFVIDVLNMEPSMMHHYAAYGFWAPSVGDYTA